MRASFLKKPFPVITGIMSGETLELLISSAQEAADDGAEGIAIDLGSLQSAFHNTDDLRRIIASVDLPFMFFYYRNSNHDDNARQQVLLATAEAGAAMIDVMGDLFDPSKREITYSPQAINKQKCLIDEIHSRGAEVVISSHMDCALSTGEVLAHLQALETRGSDVVKIVTRVDTADELAEALGTTITLHQKMKTPFIHLCTGPFSRLHRFIGPKLGPAITFAVHNQDNPHGYTQPTITAMKAVLETIDWDIHLPANS